jgi:hypothetical protein
MPITPQQVHDGATGPFAGTPPLERAARLVSAVLGRTTAVRVGPAAGTAAPAFHTALETGVGQLAA